MAHYRKSIYLQKAFSKAKQAIVVLDASIDLDAWGASIAIADLLETFNTEYRIVCASPIPIAYQLLHKTSKLIISSSFTDIQRELPNLDLIIIPDLGAFEQLGALYNDNSEHFSRVPIIHIDHHKQGTIPAWLRIIDQSAAATCEQMFLIFQDLQLPIAPHISTMLFSGIISDTRAFSTPTVTSRTLSVASSLVEVGADVVTASRLAISKTVSQLRLWGLSLSQLETACDGKVTIATITEEMLTASKSHWSESSGLVNFIDSVPEVGVAVLLKELPSGDVRASFRSPQVYPVIEIAKRFGGGGHTYAAACTLRHASLSEAKEVLVDELNNLIQKKADLPLKKRTQR